MIDSSAGRIAPLGVLLLGAGGCANSSPPANMPPPIPSAELTGTPGVPYSEIIEAAGAPTVRPGVVRDGEALVTIPYRYRHTAVLTEDVTGFSITVRGVQAPAGSPGYYAGTFISSAGSRNGAPFDMWCFLPRAAGGERENICLLRNMPALAAIAPTRDNPWLWYSFSPMTGTFNYVRTPVFERRRVDLPGDLKVEYRFDGWRGEEARIGFYAVGRHVMDLPVSRDSAGRSRLRTIGGDFIVSRDPADPAAARIAPATD
ncbi:MAG TPA: hypothetical protein VEW26_06785 [Allosphingosinicella sp.]|nr:hypothetical protein [Allosphingosinicella sp.]